MTSTIDAIATKTKVSTSVPTYQVVGQRKKPVPKPATWFGGWHVYGTTPEKLEAHTARTKDMISGAQSRGEPRPKTPPLKPGKLSVKPFLIEAAADEFMLLCQKNGNVMLSKKQLLPPDGKTKK